MTYGGAYEYGKDCLEESGVPEAALDARLLLEHVCHTGLNDLLLHRERELTKEREERYCGLIRRRAGREPLQHLTGEQEFMGLKFYVNQDVLIPRQDTETLVEEALKDIGDGMRVLDMCSGSGCILISVMKYRKDILGTAVDLSEKALETAKKNAAEHGVKERIGFICGDLFEKVEGKFDVILSNPPYIPRDEIGTLAPEVRDHEPLSALDGGEDGLLFYRRIAKEAGGYLKPGGRLFLEIGCHQAEDVRELLRENGFDGISVVHDLAGRRRVVSGRRMEAQ